MAASRCRSDDTIFGNTFAQQFLPLPVIQASPAARSCSADTSSTIVGNEDMPGNDQNMRQRLRRNIRNAVTRSSRRRYREGIHDEYLAEHSFFCSRHFPFRQPRVAPCYAKRAINCIEYGRATCLSQILTHDFSCCKNSCRVSPYYLFRQNAEKILHGLMPNRMRRAVLHLHLSIPKLSAH